MPKAKSQLSLKGKFLSSKKIPKKTILRKIPTDTIVIGIDPGQKGGLVSIDWEGKITAIPMPETERDIIDWFRGISDFSEVVACIEKVHSMPQQSAQSGFTFGQGYGFLRACLYAHDISFQEVTPQAWLKALGLKTGTQKKTGKTQWKKYLRSKAQQMYPTLPIWKEPETEGKQLAISDALLIAEHCRRINFGG